MYKIYRHFLIMNGLDVHTIVLGYLATRVTSALVVALLWKRYHRQYRGSSFWLADFLLQLVAAILMALGGQIPEALSLVGATTMAIVAGFLGYLGLEQFLGKPSRQVHNYLIIGGFVASHCYFSFIQPSLTGRDADFSIAMFLICGQSAWLMLRRASPIMRPITRDLGLVLSAACVFIFLHGVRLFVRPHGTNDLLHTGSAQGLYLLAYELISILLTFGLVFLVTGRLRLDLQQEQEKYAKVFQFSHPGVLTRSSDGKILEANGGFQEFTGYTWPELEGRRLAELQLWAQPEVWTSIIEEVAAGKPIQSREIVFRQKSGEEAWGLYSAERLIIGGEECLLSNIVDLTALKREQREREKLENHNRLLQKSESLGRMAAAIAHHFNNHLHAVMGNLELALHEQTGRDRERVEYLQGAMQAASKGSEVSQSMLTYLGQSSSKPGKLDLSLTCSRILPMLQAIMPEHGSLTTDLPADVVVNADAGRIQQVLTHLVSNAAESSQGQPVKVHLAVRTFLAAEVAAQRCFPIEFKPAAAVYSCLEVRDDGCGISSSDLERIFDPFFSSKFTGRGLGLAVVLGIAKSYRGAIAVTSQAGQGSVFRVFLPLEAKLPQTG